MLQGSLGSERQKCSELESKVLLADRKLFESESNRLYPELIGLRLVVRSW